MQRFHEIIIAFLTFILLGSSAALCQSASSVQLSRERDARVFPALVHIKYSGEDGNGVPYSSTATGFLIEKSGYILTVNHGIRKLFDNGVRSETIKIELRLGENYSEIINTDSQAIISSDIISDILILQAPSPLRNRPFLCAMPKVGDDKIALNATEIFTSGFPDGIPYISTSGYIQSFSGPGNTWVTNLRIYPGQSGSPIVLDDGEIIGIAKGEMSTLPGLYVIIPLKNIRFRVSDFATECQITASNNSMPAAEIIKANLPNVGGCVFLGKESALVTKKIDDAPFGIEKLKNDVINRTGNTELTLSAQTDTYVRSNCPTVREGSAYYGSVIGNVKSAQSINIKSIVKQSYLGDNFYWGIIDKR